MKLAAKEVSHLIWDQVESALRTCRLLMRPIQFFDHLDRFQAKEAELAPTYNQYLVHFNEITAARMLRSCAFADELSREVLRNFYPSLPQEGEWAHRTIWGAAVIIDQLLDEDGVEAARLASVLNLVNAQAGEGSFPGKGKLYDPDPGVNALAALLADTLADCRQRAVDADAYAAFNANLTRMLNAELASLSATLDTPPGEQVRAILHDKSALLSWVGFQACALGQQLSPMEAGEYQVICDAVGEILWIMDDLMDLEEDLDRGIWNRALCRLHDDVGMARFKEMRASKASLADGFTDQGIAAEEIEEIAKWLDFLESHARIRDPKRIRVMLSFWLTAWLGIYG